ncbi:MAG: Tn3 family transposase [Pseudomonadales bacterium]
MCDFFTNPEFRRVLSRLLYFGETLHTLQMALHFGSLGAARGRRHEELVAISGSLTLLTNLVLAWNTHHTQRILRQGDRRDGQYVAPAMLRHTPPVSSGHINMRGQLHFPIEDAAPRLIPNYRRAG